MSISNVVPMTILLVEDDEVDTTIRFFKVIDFIEKEKIDWTYALNCVEDD